MMKSLSQINIALSNTCADVLPPKAMCAVCVHSTKAGYGFPPSASPSSSSWCISQGQDHTGLHYDGNHLILLFSSTRKEHADNTSTAEEGIGYLVWLRCALSVRSVMFVSLSGWSYGLLWPRPPGNRRCSMCAGRPVASVCCMMMDDGKTPVREWCRAAACAGKPLCVILKSFQVSEFNVQSLVGWFPWRCLSISNKLTSASLTEFDKIDILLFILMHSWHTLNKMCVFTIKLQVNFT